jgi:hypothetical protein
VSAVSSDRHVSPAALAALQNGNKIEAIKITRKEFALDLKEAKDLVEARIAQDPVLREMFNAQSSGVLGWIFMLILVIAAVVYFFPR